MQRKEEKKEKKGEACNYIEEASTQLRGENNKLIISRIYASNGMITSQEFVLDKTIRTPGYSSIRKG